MNRQEIQLMADMHDQGWKTGVIARSLGYSQSTIYRELGLLRLDRAIPDETKAFYVGRIRSHVYDVKTVARILFVPTRLVVRWMKEEHDD